MFDGVFCFFLRFCVPKLEINCQTTQKMMKKVLQSAVFCPKMCIFARQNKESKNIL